MHTFKTIIWKNTPMFVQKKFASPHPPFLFSLLFILLTLFRARTDNSAFDNKMIYFHLHSQSDAHVYIV